MAHRSSRRRFLGAAATAVGAVASASRLRAAGANEKILVAVMGVNGRGTSLAQAFARVGGAAVVAVCDVDSRALEKAAAAAAKEQVYTPKGEGDFRRILEDKTVDALAIAAPNHWHGPATILACAAGKHVYVEKPCCHNPREGELMVEAARRHNRVVQMGTQRRSWPKIIEGIQQVREGAIGRPYYARGRYTASRGSVGRGKEVPVPSWLDYELWQGPAPRRPYRDNVIHYNWHWFWHWGNGELGNNGVHALDLCRWGLGVDYPIRATSGGGRHAFQDDQETPDTHLVTFDFEGNKTIAWEGLSSSTNSYGAKDYIAAFHGEKGALILTGTGYVLYDSRDTVVKEVSGPAGDESHVVNFLECIRSGARPTADIEEGYKSTLLPLLGNIAHRTGHTLACDPKNGHILNEKVAEAFWSREYAPGWEPRV
jgi:predicted dehydrogenase